MATRLRVFVPVGTTEYAKLWGVSQRTARRRLAAMPGAVKVGTGWKVPVLATDYAKRKGISAKAARSKGLRAATPNDAGLQISGPVHKKLKTEAASHIGKLGAQRPRFNPGTVDKRLDHASDTQLRKAKKLREDEWISLIQNPTGDWMGNDGLNILYYH